MDGQKLVFFRWMLIGLFCLNAEAFAGEARHVWTSFRQEDGLAHNVVTAVVQTPDGAMWFATLGGVSRYDGRSWKKFGVEDGLPGNAIQDLVAAPDGALWAAVGRGFSRQARQGLAYFFGEEWRGIDIPEELRGRGGLRQILGLDGGRSCLVTDAGHLLRFDGADLYLVLLDGQPLEGVQSLMADANGKVWVAYGGRGGNVLFGPGMGRGDEVNRVVGVGAVVLEGQMVPKVVEDGVNQMVGVGAEVLGMWMVQMAVEDEVDRMARAGVAVLGIWTVQMAVEVEVEDLVNLHRAWDYWMWIRGNGRR